MSLAEWLGLSFKIRDQSANLIYGSDSEFLPPPPLLRFPVPVSDSGILRSVVLEMDMSLMPFSQDAVDGFRSRLVLHRAVRL